MRSSPASRTSPATVPLWSVAALLLVLAGFLAAAPGAWAAEVRGDDNVVVAEGETVADDLYATGGDVVVDGTVRGDLVVAARRVMISGTVEGDLIAAAQTVVIEGTVGDDARLAGQVLALDEEARVAGDLVTAGYSLQVEPGAAIGGDVLLAGYQALLAGTVDGDVDAGAAALALAGRVGGNVQADVGAGEGAGPVWVPFADVPVPPVDPGLVLTDSARLEGDLAYRSGAEAAIAPGAEVAGEISYERAVVDAAEPAGPAGPPALLLDALRLFVTLLAVGLLALWLIPRTVTAAASVLRRRPFLSLGWGVVAVLGTAVAAPVILLGGILLGIGLGLLTLGGLAAAVVGTAVVADVLLVLVLVLAIALLAPIVVGLTGGGLLLRDPVPARFGRRVLALAIGLLLYVLLRAVPYLGSVVAVLVALLGTGALVVGAWESARRARRHRRGAAPPPGAAVGPMRGPQVGPGLRTDAAPGRQPDPPPGPSSPHAGSAAARPPWAAGEPRPGPGPEPDARR